MSAGAASPFSTRAESPFSPRAALALVGFGALVFVALLWMIGAGMTGGSANDGGGHAGGKGLNGYAALADLLERRGHLVRRTRSDNAFEAPGLLVLTPPQNAKPEMVDAAIEAHRNAGPTLLVLPKWEASSARVRPPGPGPTSITCRPVRSPASAAIRAQTAGSSRKCWPKLFLGRAFMRWPFCAR